MAKVERGEVRRITLLRTRLNRAQPEWPRIRRGLLEDRLCPRMPRSADRTERERIVMRRLLVDTDTATDDPVALVMALKHPGVRVEAITVVAGNVPVDQGVQNALYTLELLGE